MKTKLTLTSLLKMSAVIGAIALTGCKSQQTTQEAYATCKVLLGEDAEAEDTEVFSDCVACHEDCGTGCNQQATTPATFSCPDEEGSGGGGAGGGG